MTRNSIARRHDHDEKQALTGMERFRTNRRARRIGAVVTGLCGAIALVSASGKLTQQAAVVELLDHVEVQGLLRDILPILQIAGGLAAIGSLIRFPRLGVAALAGLALYFAGAVVAHIRVGDGPSDFAIPLGYVIVMTTAAVVRGATIAPSTIHASTIPASTIHASTR